MTEPEHHTAHEQPAKRRDTLQALRRQRLIPIVRVDRRQHALYAAEAIARAGISLLEITLTIPDALGVIEEVASLFGHQLIVGAGTVLDVENCRAAIAAGAAFVVSPATDVQVIELARAHGVVAMPGALTPTEVLTAWQAGADLVKIFPAGAVGGPAYIRALRGPYPEIPLVPSNGVDRSNARDYLTAGATAVGVGGPIFETTALARGDLDAITERAQSFAALLRQSSEA